MDASDSRTYQYRPLEDGVIRILVLLEDEDFDGDLECAIIHRPLSDSSGGEDDYTAVSYVWGSTEDMRSIFVDDKRLPISANLELALRHLRRKDRHVFLWVDAICINQVDLHERNLQVHHMRDIYASATETIVFLGVQRAGNTATSAWNFLERNSSWAMNADQERDHRMPELAEELIDFRGDLYDVFEDVLTREWFRRVWVLQEVVVSKRVSLQCGARQIPWDDFCKSILSQPREHDRYGRSLHQEANLESPRRIWETRVAYHLNRGQEKYLPSWSYGAAAQERINTELLGTLVRARDLKATDARDKIFALLGIATGFDWMAHQTINYHKSTVEVYSTFAQNFLELERDYSLLSYLHRESTIDRLKERLKFWQSIQGRWQLTANTADTNVDDWMWDVTPNPNTDERAATAALNHVETGALDILGRKSLAEEMVAEATVAVEKLRLELRRHPAMESLALSSWVPNWQTVLSSRYEPRSIMEVVRRDSKQHDARETLSSFLVQDHRCFLANGRVLAIRGKVVGNIHNYASPTSLLGKDEMVFENLRRQWSSFPHQGSLEPHILTLWAHFLDATMHAIPSRDPVVTDYSFQDYDTTERSIPVASGHYGSELSAFSMAQRRSGYEVGELLRKAPGTFYPSKPPPARSFLNIIDVNRASSPNSIEEHLVTRAKQTVEWVDEESPAMIIVNDNTSIIDRRLMGVYTDETAWRQMTLSPDASTGHSALVLLPPGALHTDIIAYFPGAEVPFLLRPEPSFEAPPDEQEMSNELKNLTKTERYIKCRIVGECWINNFETITSDVTTLDSIFLIH